MSIAYATQTGTVTSRVISEIDLAGGTMLAWCHLREDERMFNLGRVLSVGPVQPN